MIKILLGKGDVLSGRLLVYDALKMSFKVYVHAGAGAKHRRRLACASAGVKEVHCVSPRVGPIARSPGMGKTNSSCSLSTRQAVFRLSLRGEKCIAVGDTR